MTSPVPLSCYRGRAAGGRRPGGGGGHAARGRPRPGHPARIKDTSAAGNCYHNKWFVALAAELGLRGPDVPDKITGWSNCALTGQAAYGAYAEVTAGIDAARLPFLAGLASPPRPGGKDGGQDQGGDGPGKPSKRGGRRVAVECTCQPEGRRLQLTPRQIEDGPIVCGLCCAPFEVP